MSRDPSSSSAFNGLLPVSRRSSRSTTSLADGNRRRAQGARCQHRGSLPAGTGKDGLDLAALVALKAKGRALHDHPRGRKLGMEAVIDIPCDT
jgi:hypothetical protein